MEKHRLKIEELKKELREDIMSNSFRYKRAISNHIYRQSQIHSDINSKFDSEGFLSSFQKEFRLSPGEKQIIIKDLAKIKEEIGEIWNDYFYGLSGKVMLDSDMEKMLSLYQVDFSNIEKDIKEKVVREVKSGIGRGLHFDEIRRKLEHSGLGFAHAYTEANTALAQFDNSYHIESAQSAGIDEFIFDGISHNSRPFCKDRVGKSFTLDEIKEMNNGQGLAVLTSLGGYNCVHYWTAKIEQSISQKKSKVYVARDIAEAESLLKSTKLSKADKKAIKDYTWGEYEELNKYLRGEKITIPERANEYKTLSQNLSIALGKMPKYNGKVFRCMEMESIERLKEFEKKISDNKLVAMKNFISTSLKKEVATSFGNSPGSVYLEIQSKNGRFLGEHSFKPEEKEILFDKQSVFKVKKVDNKGILKVYLEEL